MMNTKTLHRSVSMPRLFAVGAALLGSLSLADEASAQGGDVGRGGGQGIGRGGRGGRGGNPEQMIERRVEHLTEALSLSETQAAEIREILADEHEAMEPLRPAQRPTTPPDEATREEMRTRMDAIHAATNEKISALLTVEQRTKYAEIEAERGPRGRGMGGPGRGGRGGRGRGGPPPDGVGGARGNRPPPPPPPAG